jgi:hypothetical protein
MYREDLSPCPIELTDPVATGRSIGWLEKGYYFQTGNTPWRFLRKLRWLSRDIKNPMWGFHKCEFCGWAKGNGEIHVVGADGITYVAPQLVVHYIATHKYRPPQQFIDAAVWSGR